LSGFEARHADDRLRIGTDEQGENTIESAWVSDCYGRRTESRAAVRRISAATLEVGVGTLLTTGPPRTALVRTEAEGGTAWRWETADAVLTALTRSAAAAHVRSGSLLSTARFCLVVERPGGMPAMLGADPGEVLEHDRPIPGLERSEPGGAR
jgi:hypothetical protein